MNYTKVERDLIRLYRKGGDALLNYVMKNEFNSVTEDDILHEPTAGKFFMNGRSVDPHIIQSYAAEAKAILSMGVFTEVLKAMQYEANKMMYEKSQVIEDMRSGKMLLFATKVMRKKFENLARKYESKPEPKIVRQVKTQ